MNEQVIELFGMLDEKINNELEKVLDDNAVDQDNKNIGAITMPFINRTADSYGMYDDFASIEDDWDSASKYVIEPMWDKICEEFSEIYTKGEVVDSLYIEDFINEYATDAKNKDAIDWLEKSIKEVDDVIDYINNSEED